jgi:hypothetical protein
MLRILKYITSPMTTGISRNRSEDSPNQYFADVHWDVGFKSTNSLKSYLFERRAVMNFAMLRSEARPLKNFAGLLSYETVGNFAALHGLPILADVRHDHERDMGF